MYIYSIQFNIWFFYRFIVHSDRSNPFLETLEEFQAEIPSFDPSVLVIGGLQMMDKFPFKEGERVVCQWVQILLLVWHFVYKSCLLRDLTKNVEISEC